jgi:hypothetical protein
LLYIGQVVKPMDEAIVENLSYLANLVLTYRSIVMIAEGLDILPITAAALILVLLAARIVKRKHGSFLKSSRARGTGTNKGPSGRLFKSQRSPALKPCPNCAEQLPLTAIICDTCDYNFLAERPGRGQKLLPPPQPMTHEVPEHKIVSVT